MAENLESNISNLDYQAVIPKRNLRSEAVKPEPASPPAMTVEDAKAIVLAEYRYWSAAPVESEGVSIGAVAAAANIYAALVGVRAPWHPKPWKINS